MARKGKNRKRKELCPRCQKIKVLTKHHIYPKRYGGHANQYNTGYVCRECHNKLEYIIMKTEQMYGTKRRYKLEKPRYREIFETFIQAPSL